MIDQESLTKEWIQQKSGENRQADPMLVEKVIRALLLLEGLVKQHLSFVFKGGTALMLHFDAAKRLSIDIDIILSNNRDALEPLFDALIDEQQFLRWELQHRDTQSSIKKVHYKFYYAPLYADHMDEDSILLDILFEESHYGALQKLPIQSPFIPLNDTPLSVKVPTIDNLLADKLTAFAPNTTGIPYAKHGDSMSMEIIKQLYDIGNLFDRAERPGAIRTTFNRFAEVELSYRDESNLTPDEVLDDIYQTALCLATRGKGGKGDFNELQQGIKRVQPYIYSERYHLDKAINHASKAAYLATLLRENGSSIKRFSEPQDVQDSVIEPPMNTRLNKIKKTDPEAFFYWYRIYELTHQV